MSRGGATVARVSLDEPLAPIELAPGHDRALLVAMAAGSVVGEVMIEGPSPLSPELQSKALGGELGQRLWRRSLTQVLRDAAGAGSAADPERRSISVVVCTRDRPSDLDRCLTSVSALRTEPHEVLVVDNSPGDPRTAEVCDRHAVRLVVEPIPGLSRARNRGIAETTGEIVAFVDDDCVVDAAWGESPVQEFSDPLVMVVCGYVGPLELETQAQYTFEMLGGFARAFDRVVYDGRTLRWPGIGDGNSFFRRDVFDEVGGFAEDLGPGSPALSGQDADLFARIFTAGYRMALDPRAIVWHGHRADHAQLRAAIFGYSVGFSAFVTRSLLGRRDPRALRYGMWWPRHVVSHALRGIRRPDQRVPSDLLVAGLLGTFAGPWRLLRSKRRTSAPPLPITMEDRIRSSSARVTAPAMTNLSVVIASRNRRERLLQTLRALDRQSYPSERFEVVVILDGTTDDSAAAIRALSTSFDLTLLEQEHRGSAATRNRGLRDAAHPVVVFLDDDIIPDPGMLAAHAGANASASEPQVTFGSYPPATDDRSFWALELRAWWEDYFRRRAEPNHRWTFVDMSEGNTSAERAVLLDVGGWDEEFTGGRRQDWEFGARLLKRGVRFRHCAAAGGSHFLDTSFATAFRNARQEGRWDVVLTRKHPELKLPFAQFGRAEGGAMSRRGRLAYQWPRVAGGLARAAVPLLSALERLNLQRQWRELSSLVLAQQYVRGVADELPTLAELREFVAQTNPEIPAVSLDIDGPPLPAANVVAPVDVEAKCGDITFGRARAPRPGEQWDWDALVERLVEEVDTSPPTELVELLADHLPEGSGDVLRAWRATSPER